MLLVAVEVSRLARPRPTRYVREYAVMDEHTNIYYIDIHVIINRSNLLSMVKLLIGFKKVVLNSAGKFFCTFTDYDEISQPIYLIMFFV